MLFVLSKTCVKSTPAGQSLLDQNPGHVTTVAVPNICLAAGASSIRAYGLQTSFIKQNESRVDTNQMSYYPNIVSNR